MDAHLLKLKQESYEAASEYHRAMGEWFAASRSQKAGGDDVSITLLEYRALAANYSNALEVLAAYLKTFDSLLKKSRRRKETWLSPNDGR
jgi:hypothetical protein